MDGLTAGERILLFAILALLAAAGLVHMGKRSYPAGDEPVADATPQAAAQMAGQ